MSNSPSASTPTAGSPNESSAASSDHRSLWDRLQSDDPRPTMERLSDLNLRVARNTAALDALPNAADIIAAVTGPFVELARPRPYQFQQPAALARRPCSG